MSKHRILVTGGNGYVGGACVRHLLGLGHAVVILDNGSRSPRARIPAGAVYIKANLSDTALVSKTLKEHAIESVVHCAAYAYVEESVRDPFLYYHNNLSESIAFLEAAYRAGVRRYAFSSSCATYGIPETLPITETTAQRPISPYGQTKYFGESILATMAQELGCSAVALRYFNAAGAAQNASWGEEHEPETHLIPNCIMTALGKRPHMTIYGDTHPTADGTCLRDFVHIDDLALAHSLALHALHSRPLGWFEAYNLSIGQPYSVRQVIQSVERISGTRLATRILPARAGDPPALYADATKARQQLGWEPRYTELDPIVQTAWVWHRQSCEHVH